MPNWVNKRIQEAAGHHRKWEHIRGMFYTQIFIVEVLRGIIQSISPRQFA